jgi:general stress protein 26
MATNGNGASEIRKLRRLVRGIRVAMLTTCAEDGSLHSRPMATCEISKDGSLWFFTYANTCKVLEVGQNHKVNANYANPEDNRYVAVAGTAELVQDRDKMEELWSPRLYEWFPQGVDTHDIALLRVEVERVEYWDLNAGRFSNLVERLMGAVLHTPVFPAKHGRIEITHAEPTPPPAA